MKVLGILALVAVALLAVAFFGLATVCGGLRDQKAIPFMLLALVIAVAATAGAVVLLRSLIAAGAAQKAAARGPLAPAEAPPARDLAAEASSLAHLRVALGVRLALSALFVALSLSDANAPPRALLPMLASLAVHLLPFLWVLWAIRAQPARFALWFALAYALTGGLFSLWSLATTWRFLAAAQAAYAARSALTVAVDVAIALLAWRARRALPEENDADRGVIAFLVAFVYMALATALTTQLYRLLSS